MIVGAVIAALLTVPAQGPETVATVTAPARTATVTREQLDRWTSFSAAATTDARQAEALRLLIEAAWTEGEALERGVTVTGSEIRSEAEPDDELTRADELLIARVDLLNARLRDQITEPAAKSVTPEQIEAYVRANPRMDPEERRVRVVETQGRIHAKRALAGLARGLTWRIAARRYGTGSARRTVQDGPDLRGWQRAVMHADKNVLTRHGRFVLKVIRIRGERPAPVGVQRAQAWEILSSAAQQQALAAHDAAFRAKWRARTVCALAFAGHESCANPPFGE